MGFFKQMNVTLLISVILIIPTSINSKIIISEFKLWGEPSSHFIEVYNTDNTTDVPFSSNYSVFLLDKPNNATSGLKVLHVIDISQYDVVNASGYIAIETPNISIVVDENNTYAIVIHELKNGNDFNIGDIVKAEEVEDSVVYTHNENSKISLLSYQLGVINDHYVHLDIRQNESLNACEDLATGNKVHVFEFRKPSSGKPNLCIEPVTDAPTTPPSSKQTSPSPATSTNSSTTTMLQTTIPSTTVNDTSSTVPVTSPSPKPVTASTTLAPPIPTTIHNLIDPSNLTINEFNIYIGQHSHIHFIEIHGQRDAYFENTTLEMINGGDGSSIGSFDITHTDERGLFVINMSSVESSINSLAMAIKQGESVIDGFVISRDGSVLENVTEMYSPTRDIFILDPSVVNMPADSAISVSKCGRHPGIIDGGFMLTSASMGNPNNCSTYYSKKIQLKLKDGDCKFFEDIKLKNEIAEEIIRITSKSCKCGLSSPVLQERSILCGTGSVIFEAYIKTLTKQESENYYKIYQEFVNNTKKITIGHKEYDIDNTCYYDCDVHKQPTTSKTDDGNINVTIAIVVTCVVIFIVIVIIVVILLKKKRNGTLQFSMVRLEEDNNLLMDDAKGVRFREGSAIII